MEVGLHQGPVMVMDTLTDEARQESSWTMMFADNIVNCSESREEVEDNVERWRYGLEKRGTKVSCSDTAYMCANRKDSVEQ